MTKREYIKARLIVLKRMLQEGKLVFLEEDQVEKVNINRGYIYLGPVSCFEFRASEFDSIEEIEAYLQEYITWYEGPIHKGLPLE